ncbi:hypothetical protein M378DRAFT_557332 [Amanita muscaria Koide BX008]|uniref:G domain-containing protein n=1 Tax=Amanita muscaria (strain Koide BX008) TaxID=946122 RepID=A0A0C2SPA4_AMAMK|nr:hypothetical protein M378DRAFT_557332 [Amanita muscaria Koide BX008]
MMVWAPGGETSNLGTSRLWFQAWHSDSLWCLPLATKEADIDDAICYSIWVLSIPLPKQTVHMSRNNDSDSTLSSTFDAITSDCPQIRILVLGKTGCGKSSLINKAFGLEKDLAKVSHDRPGEADINREFRHPSNNRFSCMTPKASSPDRMQSSTP